MEGLSSLDALGVRVRCMGFKGLPDAEGALELGYGINASQRNHGFASEMAEALTAWALARPDVRFLKAACRKDNVASVRVLEKAEFLRVSSRIDDEDGPLILWEKREAL